MGGGDFFKTRPCTKGMPYIDELEAHAASCMATGISAKQRRDQIMLNKDYIFKNNNETNRAFVVTEEKLFRVLLERAGSESLLYAFIQIVVGKELL